MNILLLCGGEQRRLPIDYPKQLIVVAGETLLARTLRIARSHDPDCTVVLVGRRGVFMDAAAELGIAEHVVEEQPMLFNVQLTMRALQFQCATVLLGDVCWSERMLRGFLSEARKRPTLACARLGPSSVTGKPYSEHFGLSATLEDLRALDARRFYRIEDAARTNVWGAERMLLAPPDDFTEDIDTPEDMKLVPLLETLVRSEGNL